MTEADLVERLRKWIAEREPGDSGSSTLALMREAAAEIERLRFNLQHFGVTDYLNETRADDADPSASI